MNGDDWSHSPFVRRSPNRFSGIFLSWMAEQPPGSFFITLINSDWRDTRGKWPLFRNPDRSWWHRHTSLKLFWPQPMAPWTTGQKLFWPQLLTPWTTGHFSILSLPILSLFPSFPNLQTISTVFLLLFQKCCVGHLQFLWYWGS